MVEDYSYNGCPVIDVEEFNRAIKVLPTREECNKNTKSDTYSVFLDGNEEKFVMFDWDMKANQWRVRNRIVAKISTLLFYCECKGTALQHIINLKGDKKKCKQCGKISNI